MSHGPGPEHEQETPSRIGAPCTSPLTFSTLARLPQRECQELRGREALRVSCETASVPVNTPENACPHSDQSNVTCVRAAQAVGNSNRLRPRLTSVPDFTRPRLQLRLSSRARDQPLSFAHPIRPGSLTQRNCLHQQQPALRCKRSCWKRSRRSGGASAAMLWTTHLEKRLLLDPASVSARPVLHAAQISAGTVVARSTSSSK